MYCSNDRCVGALRKRRQYAIAGTVEALFDGHVLAVKSDKLGEVKVSLTSNVARVAASAKATLADIELGSIIGVGAMPQPDGSDVHSR